MRFLQLAIIFTTLVLAGCSQKGPEISEPNEQEEEQVLSIGQEISGRLLSGLIKELNSALNEGGLEYAIGFCHFRAIPFTDSLSHDMDERYEVKRTTNNFRNPENAPDDFEKQALKFYEDLVLESNPLPPYFIQKITDKSTNYFYYYRPLRVAGLCLKCHGDPAGMDKNILEAINQTYPNDMALGYKEGDFRGLIRVKVELSD